MLEVSHDDLGTISLRVLLTLNEKATSATFEWLDRICERPAGNR